MTLFIAFLDLRIMMVIFVNLILIAAETYKEVDANKYAKVLARSVGPQQQQSKQRKPKQQSEQQQPRQQQPKQQQQHPKQKQQPK